ncbi:GNAT family N-acetyltransferase [Tetragenococcus koreensis]|uniref:GNAT family N-acetyltransferase n=1 Tax=Tetragenococcus koreensis TaxID=290335 RepID=UPI001F301903|nr:GNAT family N-acetyltransferase [Tetragenococcus koreensis]MCF1631381.1 GNAT family N-acetyltransferase [Tetragenococcus koreensis]
MKLSTNRTLLRPFQPSDFSDTFAFYQREDVCQFLLHGPWTDENAMQMFEEKVQKNNFSTNNALQLAVEFEQQVIGDISIFPTDMPVSVEIGYVFHPAYAGQGFALETLQAVINYLFETQKIHRIQAVLDKRNVASEKLCQRIGMRKEGDFKKDFWNKGMWTNTLIYGLLREEFYS